MSKCIVAVCDVEDGYRCRFVAYLMERRAGEFVIHSFSDTGLFLEELKGSVYDLVILGKGFSDIEETVKSQRVPLLLLKDMMTKEDGGNAEQGLPETISAFRYQPMEMILHEMQVLTGKVLEQNVRKSGTIPGMEVIGVCSPVRHEMQIPFSVVAAAFLAERRKVLYVNLMGYSGFPGLFGLEGEHDPGDIILRLRNGRLPPEVFWKSVYETDRLYYIPPFVNPENLHELTLEDYEAFLLYLDERTDFDIVFLDFGEGLSRFSGMLERCTSIYCLIRTGYFFDFQTEQFRSWLESEAGTGILDRLHFVELPFSARRIRGGKSVLRQLQWSEFGDYVRGRLTGAGYENM